jgi:hypothetical protein
VPAGVGILFSEMAHQFLHALSVPPNTLQILLEVFMEFGSIGHRAFNSIEECAQCENISKSIQSSSFLCFPFFSPYYPQAMHYVLP